MTHQVRARRELIIAAGVVFAIEVRNTGRQREICRRIKRHATAVDGRGDGAIKEQASIGTCTTCAVRVPLCHIHLIDEWRIGISIDETVAIEI